MLGMAGAAALIAGVTVLARIAGFGRIVVFSRSVGQTCLGDTYQSVNTVPNIVFEIVAGGALAGLVVPLLARAVSDGDAARAARIGSALLTWTIVLLTPVAVAVAVFAQPIAALLLGSKGCTGAVDVGASMLRVFAPQIVLYGVGIVLTGVLQAHRRFGGSALAPLLSSLVVIGAYVAFAWATPSGIDVATLDPSDELILSGGTTLGVAVLALSLLAPLARLGLDLRPRLRFPTGVAARARRLAAAGIVALVAQQVAVGVALVLGNGAGVPDGSVTVFLYAQTVYLLPWAVLAVPVATAVFPRLAERADTGDRAGYAALLSTAIRIVLLGALGSAAVLIATAEPLARLVVESAPGRPSVAALSHGIAAFAPGLLGYGLFAVCSRALYAAGAARATALACVAGWFTVVAADVILAGAFPPGDRVPVLAWGNTIGMAVLGTALLSVTARRSGRAAVAGVLRSGACGLLAAGVGTGCGLVVVRLVDGSGPLQAVGAAALVASCVVAAFAATLVVTSRGELRALAADGFRGRSTRSGPPTAAPVTVPEESP